MVLLVEYRSSMDYYLSVGLIIWFVYGYGWICRLRYDDDGAREDLFALVVVVE